MLFICNIGDKWDVWDARKRSSIVTLKFPLLSSWIGSVCVGPDVVERINSWCEHVISNVESAEKGKQWKNKIFF